MSASLVGSEMCIRDRAAAREARRRPWHRGPPLRRVPPRLRARGADALPQEGRGQEQGREGPGGRQAGRVRLQEGRASRTEARRD
eukprot:15437322-Alexandrium_andersonii.AAC.1